MSSPDRKHQQRSSSPFSAPDVYYGSQAPSAPYDSKRRVFSMQVEKGTQHVIDAIKQHRRSSQNSLGEQPRQFMIPVESTLHELLAQEDTSKKGQITIADAGPKASARLDEM